MNCGSPSTANLNISYYVAYPTLQCSINILLWSLGGRQGRQHRTLGAKLLEKL